jgi:hypothetical protein
MDNLSLTEVDAEGRIVAVISFGPTTAAPPTWSCSTARPAATRCGPQSSSTFGAR